MVTTPATNPVPRASILAVGDELLIGQVINSNAAWIGDKLTEAGYVVVRHTVVGDDRRAIAMALQDCATDSDVVLVSGGLGPTHDDLTVESIAAWAGLELEEDPAVVERIRGFFLARGREMTENNRRQALRPYGSELIDNDCGTAPGHWLPMPMAKGRGHVVLMPGVPHEMKSMMERFVLPRLRAAAAGAAVLRCTLHTAGVGESVLATKLDGVQALLGPDVTLAYLPSLGEVRLRVTARGSTETQARALLEPVEVFLRDRLGHHVYDGDGGTLEAAVGQLLVQRGFTLAAAESCTGGYFNHRMTNVAGSSRYIRGGIVAYANEIKTKELGVPVEFFATAGAVSREVAAAMAEGVRRKFAADIGVGITGVAGPGGGTPEKPIGLVYIAVADSAGVDVRRMQFENDRLRNKERTVSAALNLVRLRLMGVLE